MSRPHLHRNRRRKLKEYLLRSTVFLSEILRLLLKIRRHYRHLTLLFDGIKVLDKYHPCTMIFLSHSFVSYISCVMFPSFMLPVLFRNVKVTRSFFFFFFLLNFFIELKTSFTMLVKNKH